MPGGSTKYILSLECAVKSPLKHAASTTQGPFAEYSVPLLTEALPLEWISQRIRLVPHRSALLYFFLLFLFIARPVIYQKVIKDKVFDDKPAGYPVGNQVLACAEHVGGQFTSWNTTSGHRRAVKPF